MAVKKEEQLVAIKRIDQAFEHTIFTKRILRELIILRSFSHDNVIKIKNVIAPKNPNNFEDLYVVYELMETDLGAIIKSEQAITKNHIVFFIYQILRGLKYIHSAKILHRDLV